MTAVSFCPKCGSAVKPEFEFCTTCGFALSGVREGGTGNSTPIPQIPEPAAVTPAPPVSAATPVPVAQPAIKTTGSDTRPPGVPLFSRQVHIIIIAVILAGLAVWIWSMENQKNKGTKDTGTIISGPGKQTEELTTLPTVEKENRLQAEDFAGTWRAYETNNPEEDKNELGKPENDLFIEVNNGSFSIYPRNEKDKEHSAEFTCGELTGNTISCSGYSRDEKENFSLKMEMQESKNEMTMTISPEKPTEIMIIKMRRL